MIRYDEGIAADYSRLRRVHLRLVGTQKRRTEHVAER
jgi:hypothetical protein